jgi:hypothetical protein
MYMAAAGRRHAPVVGGAERAGTPEAVLKIVQAPREFRVAAAE